MHVMNLEGGIPDRCRSPPASTQLLLRHRPTLILSVIARHGARHEGPVKEYFPEIEVESRKQGSLSSPNSGDEAVKVRAR